jgi:hypothetical protein
MRPRDLGWKVSRFWLVLPLLVLLPTKPAHAQLDLTGEWSPRVYNENRDVGDFTGLPINAAALYRAESWTGDQDALPENARCYWPFDLGFRVAPSAMLIYSVRDPDTRQIVAIHFHSAWSDLEVWMDGRPHPPDYALSTYQGFSTGKWVDNATLEITTDHLKEGVFTRNGVIRSSKAKVTTLVNRFGDVLSITVIVDDPVYLTEPYIRSESWSYAPGQVTQDAAARCEIPPEGGLVPAGAVPTFMPGKNETLHDYAIEYGLPPDAALGGAETTYPEYIKKMKTMKTEPRTTTKHYRRYG